MLNFLDKKLQLIPTILVFGWGNGSRRSSTINNNHEKEIVEFLKRYAEKLSMRLVCHANSMSYAIVKRKVQETNEEVEDVINDPLNEEQRQEMTDVQASLENYSVHNRELEDLPNVPLKKNANRLLEALRSLRVTPLQGNGPDVDRKHIPSEYKMNSRDNRLLLLAGLIDSDGSYRMIHNDFHFSQARVWHQRLFNDTVWVARSLGFNVYTWEDVKETMPPGRPTSHTGVYMFARIKGHIQEVPCLLHRKQPRLRLTKNDPLVSSIKADATPSASCYSIKFEGSKKKFLCSDFFCAAW